MKRKKWLLLVVLAVALGGGGFGLVRSRGNNKDIPPLVTVREGPLALKVSETGTVQPLLQVEVKSKVGGRIKRMYVDEGDWVKAGQIVAELEVPELERQADQTRAQVDAARARVNEERAALTLAERQTAAELDQAKAALAEAQARLEQVRAGPRQQEIARAKAAVGEAQVRVADARRTLERKRDLLAKGFVSQQEVDAAQTENDVTKQALDQAQESLNLLLAGSRPEEVRAAEQEVARSRALLAVASANLQQVALRKATIAQALAAERQIEKVLEEVETRLHDAVIFAPRSGRVIRRSIREGELITSGVATFTAGMPIVTIADLSKMLVKVNLNEVDIARVHLGAPAEITLDALHGRRFHGRVSKIAPSSTEGLAATDLPPGRQAIVRFPVEVEISDPCPEMRPGMTANIDLIIERADRAVFVPNDAVHGSPQRRVWLMTPEGLREQPVETGIVNETYTQIKSGLKAGDKVALHIKVPVKRRVVDMERSSAARHISERARR